MTSDELKRQEEATMPVNLLAWFPMQQSQVTLVFQQGLSRLSCCRKHTQTTGSWWATSLWRVQFRSSPSGGTDCWGRGRALIERKNVLHEFQYESRATSGPCVLFTDGLQLIVSTSLLKFYSIQSMLVDLSIWFTCLSAILKHKVDHWALSKLRSLCVLHAANAVI